MAYARDTYDGPLKQYYQPRYTYNYLPPQYNTSGVYSDYLPSRRSSRRASSWQGARGGDYPYTSPMGYQTVSDRRAQDYNAYYGTSYGEPRWQARRDYNPSYPYGQGDELGYDQSYRYLSRDKIGAYRTIDEMLGRLYSYDYSRPCELRLVRPVYQPVTRSGSPGLDVSIRQECVTSERDAVAHHPPVSVSTP